MKKSILALGALAVFAAAAAHAQSGPTTQFSIEPRAGLSIPVGDTGDDAEVGLSISGDVIYQVTPMVGVYGGYNYNRFAFKDTDDADGEIKGFDAGLRVSFSPTAGFTPFVKGGALYQKAAITGDGGSISGDYELGFNVGAGVDVPVGGRFSFTPQAAFNKVKEAEYVTVEAGLRIRL